MLDQLEYEIQLYFWCDRREKPEDLKTKMEAEAGRFGRHVSAGRWGGDVPYLSMAIRATIPNAEAIATRLCAFAREGLSEYPVKIGLNRVSMFPWLKEPIYPARITVTYDASEDLALAISHLRAEARRGHYALGTGEGVMRCYVEVERLDASQGHGFVILSEPGWSGIIVTALQLGWLADSHGFGSFRDKGEVLTGPESRISKSRPNIKVERVEIAEVT